MTREREKAMSKQTKLSHAIKRRLVKTLLLCTLTLATFAPFVVNAAADQTQTRQNTATPTPTPEPIKPPTEQMVSWNT